MALKYFDAAAKIRQPNPKASYYADYDAMLDLGFENAPNVVYNEVEYEATYGEEDFVIIPRIRVDTILNYNTGIILGDDYKTFIFPPEFKIQPYYGMKFKWQGSYWLVINTNSYASLPTSAEVRRCNNVLRFFNSKGERVYEPCIMDYTLRFANNEDTMTIAVGNGEQKVWCQRNSRTANITANERFLFGTPEQRVAFRLYAGGAKNYLNGVTMDDSSPTITEFYVDHYEVNPLYDDIENGFADAYLNEVTISIINASTQLNVGDSDVFETEVKRQSQVMDNVDIQWSSSNDTIVSVDNGVITAHALGEATITATIVDTNIASSVLVSVIETAIDDIYELIVSPNIDYVLQNTSTTFHVYLYKNGVKQPDIVTFADLSKNIPINKYTITSDTDNEFTITNYGMYMESPVIVKCVSGAHELTLYIKLRGLY